MRYPAVAGRFYPSDRADLLSIIGSCFDHRLGPGRPEGCRNGRRIRGAVVPHAGYQCSGMIAAHSFRRIAEDGRPDAYIVIGPDHYGIPYDVALCGESYLTPLGECPVHREITERLSKHYPDSPASHRLEHSVEVEIPFIQYIDPDARIVPIIMSDQSPDSAAELGRRIREACEGFDAVIIASSDLCHYIPKDEADRKDAMFMERVVSSDIEGMYGTIARYDMTVCGYGPIAAMITAVGECKASLLKLSDSYESLRYQRDSVVGYGSAVFEK